MQQHASSLAAFLDRHFALTGEHGTSLYPSQNPSQLRLMEAMRYSLLQEGGKRFRPVLAMLTAEALGCSAERAVAVGAAIECVHTYSLIHDDLPAMDNDDFRRGQPTSHRKFDEATAILAGDALLTEAFTILAQYYREEPAIGLELVTELAKAAGAYGMVGGQAIDMNTKTGAKLSLAELRTMHQLKTGALIRVSALGAAIACGANERQRAELTAYAENLGLAFQVADDLLDFDPARPEAGSYPVLLGPSDGFEKTRTFLDELTQSCLNCLSSWPSSADPLRAIAKYNGARKV